MPETGTDRDALVTRLNRIEGQVRGITRMIGRDAYCIETLTQISAALNRPRFSAALIRVAALG